MGSPRTARPAPVGAGLHRTPSGPCARGCSALYALSSPYASKAEINGQTTDKMAHQSAMDNSTMIIGAAHSGRTVSR
jgi:hypothetical protein